jgi:mannose-1-phosphate guanylyltransferase
MRHAVLMAGGSGTRLWPLSRKSSPKQFRQFIGERTLIQQTYDRIAKNVEAANIWVVTSEDYAELVRTQLPQVNPERIITEPVGRNTAPAVALAMLHINKVDPDAVAFGLLPSDHHIGKEGVFNETVEAIFQFVEKRPELVATIGINPTNPNTGLGYIKMGEQLDKIAAQKIFTVESFHEKPDLETAQDFLDQWEYLWNGGYYLFNVAQMIAHYRRLAPEIIDKVGEYIDKPSPELYESIPNEPIDKAIAEKLDSLAVAPADMEWSDIGNWATLHEILGEDGELKPVVRGNHVGVNSERVFILGGKRLIATVGLDDLVVVETDDAVLISHRDAVQDVKKIVELLQSQNREEYL